MNKLLDKRKRKGWILDPLFFREWVEMFSFMLVAAKKGSSSSYKLREREHVNAWQHSFRHLLISSNKWKTRLALRQKRAMYLRTRPSCP